MRPRALLPAPSEVEAERVAVASPLQVADLVGVYPGWAEVAARGLELAEADLTDRRLATVLRAWRVCQAQGPAGALQVAAVMERLGGAGLMPLPELVALQQSAASVPELAVQSLRAVREAACDRRARALTQQALETSDPAQRAALLTQAQAELAQRGGPQRKALDSTCAADVQPEQLRWLWRGRIPYGALSLLVGDPGQGKSALTVHLTAVVTQGWQLPGDQEPHERGNVVLCAHEDPRAAVLVPRLAAAGADLRRVRLLNDYPKFPGSIQMLTETCRQHQARLVVIDPIGGYIDGRLNSWSDSELRSALTPLQAMAEELGCAVLMVAHMNKGAGRPGLYRIGGSIAFVGVARSALLLAPDPQAPEVRVVAPLKGNVAKPPPSLAFTLEDTDGEVPRIEWRGESKLTADGLLAVDAGKKDPQAVKTAILFLKQLLSAGPMPAADVEEQAEAAGIAEKTLRRAKKRAHVVSTRTGGLGADGTWIWRLPTDAELNHVRNGRRAQA